MYISCFVFRSAPVLIAVKQIFFKSSMFICFEHLSIMSFSTAAIPSVQQEPYHTHSPAALLSQKNIVFIHLIPVQSCIHSMSSQQQDVFVHTVQPFFNVIVLKSTKDLGKKKIITLLYFVYFTPLVS